MNEEEPKGLTDVQRREIEIVNGAPINHPLKRQFQLAVDWSRKTGIEVDPLNIISVNQAIERWVDSKPSISDVYRQCISGVGFKTHPRIMGDFSKFTLADLEFFAQNGSLPPN